MKKGQINTSSISQTGKYKVGKENSVFYDCIFFAGEINSELTFKSCVSLFQVAWLNGSLGKKEETWQVTSQCSHCWPLLSHTSYRPGTFRRSLLARYLLTATRDCQKRRSPRLSLSRSPQAAVIFWLGLAKPYCSFFSISPEKKLFVSTCG